MRYKNFSDNKNMDALSDRRLAENEVIFRQFNTEIKDFVLEDAQDTVYAHRPLRFYCECSNMDCRERLEITAQEYDKLHANRKHFTVKPGHVIPEIEKIIKKAKEYEVVEKKQVPPAPKDIDPKLFL